MEVLIKNRKSDFTNLNSGSYYRNQNMYLKFRLIRNRNFQFHPSYLFLMKLNQNFKAIPVSVNQNWNSGRTLLSLVFTHMQTMLLSPSLTLIPLT